MKRSLLICALTLGMMSFNVSHADVARKPIKHLSFFINVFYPNSFFFKELGDGFSRLKKDGVLDSVEIINYHNDSEQLKKSFDKALADSDAIIMNFHTDLLIRDYCIKEARKKNIPIIFVFTKPTVKQLLNNPNLFYVTQDEVQSGVTQGLLVSRYLKKHPDTDKNHDGIINIINISGNGYSVPDESERFNWQLNTIDNYPGNKYKTKEIDNHPAQYDFNKSKDYVASLLESGKIKDAEIIITQDDQMALGALEALQGSQYSNIPIFARNNPPNLLQKIKEGSEIVGTVKSSPGDITYYAGRLAYNYLNKLDMNTDIPYRIYRHTIELPYEIITTDDLRNNK